MLPSESKDEDEGEGGEEGSIQRGMVEEMREIRREREERVYEVRKEERRREKWGMGEINERVRKALQKSEQALESFKGWQE